MPPAQEVSALLVLSLAPPHAQPCQHCCLHDAIVNRITETIQVKATSWMGFDAGENVCLCSNCSPAPDLPGSSECPKLSSLMLCFGMTLWQKPSPFRLARWDGPQSKVQSCGNPTREGPINFKIKGILETWEGTVMSLFIDKPAEIPRWWLWVGEGHYPVLLESR